MLEPWMIKKLAYADTLARRARDAALAGQGSQAAQLRAEFDQVYDRLEGVLDDIGKSFFSSNHSDINQDEQSSAKKSK